MNLDHVRELVTTHLPATYPPLLLTLYGEQQKPRGNYVVIGNDCGTDLCVDMDDGAVYSIDPDGVLPTRFVNSSIEQYAEFIRFYDRLVNGTKVSDENVSGNEVRNKLRQLDPKALNDANNWWSCIYEELDD